MASRFLPSDVGGSIPGSSFSTPLLFNCYQFGGTLSGSGWENSSSDVRKPAQEITRADIDWRYEHEARVMRELVRVKSIESTPARPFINSNMLYSTHGHRFGYEQRNPFLGYTANASPVNSIPRERQETGNFTGHENEVLSHYAFSHNRDLRGVKVLRNSKLCRWSQANVEGNFPIMRLPEPDVANKLTAVRASLPESGIPGNIPLRHCPDGSHEGKMPCYGSVTSGNVQIYHRPQASVTRKLPSDNHSVSEILIKANIHDRKDEKGCTKENLTNVSAAKVLYGSVNSESHLLHHLDNIENSSPGRSVCLNGTGLPENSKKQKTRPFNLRKSMKKKTHSALETQSSIPGEKAVEEPSCSFSKAESTSLCSVEVHVEGKKHSAEGGSSIAATKGFKKVKYATKKVAYGMKKVKNVKRASKRRNRDRKFWCEMCNVEGINETLMLIHRNGKKHLKKLRKNRGAVLVVSSNQIDKKSIVKRR